MKMSLTLGLCLLSMLAAKFAFGQPVIEFKIVCEGASGPNLDKINRVYDYSAGTFTFYMTNETKKDSEPEIFWEFDDPRVHYSEQHDDYGDFMILQAKEKGITGENDPDMYTFEFKTKFEFDDGSEPWSKIYVTESRAELDKHGYLEWVDSKSRERERCRLETLTKEKQE